MKTILLAGAAALLFVGGASAQIQSPAQPGMAPATGYSAQGSAAGTMGSSGTTAGTPVRRARPAASTRRAPRNDEASRAYMGGGVILENGRAVDMPMMPDRGVGTARGLPRDPTGMGTNRMPGGTGTGAGAGATGSGGN